DLVQIVDVAAEQQAGTVGERAVADQRLVLVLVAFLGDVRFDAYPFLARGVGPTRQVGGYGRASRVQQHVVGEPVGRPGGAPLEFGRQRRAALPNVKRGITLSFLRQPAAYGFE